MNLSKVFEDVNLMPESKTPSWWSWISPLQTSTTILWSKPKHKHKLNPFFSCRERKETQTQKLEYIDQNPPSILLWFWFWFWFWFDFSQCVTMSTNTNSAKSPNTNGASFRDFLQKKILTQTQKPLRISVWRESDRMKS